MRILPVNKKFAQIFDKVSGSFALLGFFTGRLKSIPVPLVTLIFNWISFGAFLICYLSWLLAASLSPDQHKLTKKWYGFLPFREQFQASAIIGLIATILCVAYPPLIVPGLWLYALSNIVWTIGEYHKKKKPPEEEALFSKKRHHQYVVYASHVTAISLFASLAGTVMFFFPPAIFLAMTIVTVLGSLLTLSGLYFFGRYYFGKFEPDNSSGKVSSPEKQPAEVEKVECNPEPILTDKVSYQSLPFLKVLRTHKADVDKRETEPFIYNENPRVNRS